MACSCIGTLLDAVLRMALASPSYPPKAQGICSSYDVSSAKRLSFLLYSLMAITQDAHTETGEAKMTWAIILNVACKLGCSGANIVVSNFTFGVAALF